MNITITKTNLLTFGNGNAKLGKEIATFSLPSGYTCPMALHCLSKADKATGKITDGSETLFRCFSASQEATFPNVRRARWSNFEALRSVAFASNASTLSDLINANLPKQNIVRVHVAGDFYSQSYFDAWLEVARNNPKKIFYAYTKSLTFWVARLNEIPSNFKLNASRGGKQDALIDTHGLKFAEVVFSEQEAADKGLVIDHDDTHAFAQDKSFALLLHGAQAKGSKAASALKELKKQGKGGYPSKKKTSLAVVLP